MKDYLEIEEVKQERESYRNSIIGQQQLALQNIFFKEHVSSFKSLFDHLSKSIKKGNFKVNEIYIVPVCEENLYIPLIATVACILREDGYLYFARSPQLACLGLGYRIKDGKLEDCL